MRTGTATAPATFIRRAGIGMLLLLMSAARLAAQLDADEPVEVDHSNSIAGGRDDSDPYPGWYDCLRLTLATNIADPNDPVPPCGPPETIVTPLHDHPGVQPPSARSSMVMYSATLLAWETSFVRFALAAGRGLPMHRLDHALALIEVRWKSDSSRRWVLMALEAVQRTDSTMQAWQFPAAWLALLRAHGQHPPSAATTGAITVERPGIGLQVLAHRPTNRDVYLFVSLVTGALVDPGEREFDLEPIDASITRRARVDAHVRRTAWRRMVEEVPRVFFAGGW